VIATFFNSLKVELFVSIVEAYNSGAMFVWLGLALVAQNTVHVCVANKNSGVA
jgi:hypothetical protein